MEWLYKGSIPLPLTNLKLNIMETFKIIVEINPKFSNGCEWYNNGETYEVYLSFGDYVVVGLDWGIRKLDCRVIK